ncbi:MAG: DUF167 domain-containing protein [Candidatus Omnitrophota bacterium]
MQIYRITVKIKPNSRIETVEKLSDSEFRAKVNAPAKEGRANEALVELLSDYFAVPKSRISIKKGLKSRIKTVEIIKP